MNDANGDDLAKVSAKDLSWIFHLAAESMPAKDLEA